MVIRISDNLSPEDFKPRLALAAVFILLLFGILFFRIWHLQIFYGEKWRKFSEENRIEIKRIPAMRGRVLDRNQIVIAESRPSFDLVLNQSRLEGTGQNLIQNLSSFLSFEKEEVFPKDFSKENRLGPIMLKRDMSRDELARFLARQFTFPGVEVVASPARAYPFQTLGSHFLGYLSEINKKELEQFSEDENSDYRMGDIWGVSGVERYLDQKLRGQAGSWPIVRDVRGREVQGEISDDLLPDFRQKDPSPGEDVVLTVDVRLQKIAEDSLGSNTGSVVALDPTNGDVLVLVSKPEYEPAKFSRGVSSDYWNELIGNPKNPLYDRALRGLYAPGSTFKIVTSIAALEEKVVTPEEKIFCPGHYRLGRETKSCWKKEGHGWVDFHMALVHSCDVYFYEMGRRLGVDRIAKYATQLGLGTPTGIMINREEGGLIPTEAWKKKVYRQPWVGGESLSVAIGQGFVQVTPIQMAVLLAAVVNGGKIFQPRMVLRSQSMGGKTLKNFPSIASDRITISPSTISHVLEGLKGVVNEPGGTAYWSARLPNVLVGGKTGTAQVVSLKSRKKIGDHAWFVAFAPVENPKIVISVISENAGHGSSAAAPIAKKVIEAYLEPKN